MSTGDDHEHPCSGRDGRHRAPYRDEVAARRRVVRYLAAQTPERLAGLGFGPVEIAALRRGELELPAR